MFKKCCFVENPNNFTGKISQVTRRGSVPPIFYSQLKTRILFLKTSYKSPNSRNIQETLVARIWNIVIGNLIQVHCCSTTFTRSVVQGQLHCVVVRKAAEILRFWRCT